MRSVGVPTRSAGGLVGDGTDGGTPLPVGRCAARCFSRPFGGERGLPRGAPAPATRRSAPPGITMSILYSFFACPWLPTVGPCGARCGYGAAAPTPARRRRNGPRLGLPPSIRCGRHAAAADDPPPDARRPSARTARPVGGAGGPTAADGRRSRRTAPRDAGATADASVGGPDAAAASGRDAHRRPTPCETRPPPTRGAAVRRACPPSPAWRRASGHTAWGAGGAPPVWRRRSGPPRWADSGAAGGRSGRRGGGRGRRSGARSQRRAVRPYGCGGGVGGGQPMCSWRARTRADAGGSTRARAPRVAIATHECTPAPLPAAATHPRGSPRRMSHCPRAVGPGGARGHSS